MRKPLAGRGLKNDGPMAGNRKSNDLCPSEFRARAEGALLKTVAAMMEPCS